VGHNGVLYITERSHGVKVTFRLALSMCCVNSTSHVSGAKTEASSVHGCSRRSLEERAVNHQTPNPKTQRSSKAQAPTNEAVEGRPARVEGRKQMAALFRDSATNALIDVITPSIAIEPASRQSCALSGAVLPDGHWSDAPYQRCGFLPWGNPRRGRVKRVPVA
jgi:hypothetical protein